MSAVLSGIVISKIYDVKTNSIEKEFVFTIENIKNEINQHLSPISNSMHIAPSVITQMMDQRANTSILVNAAERMHLLNVFESYLKSYPNIEMLYFGDKQGNFVMKSRRDNQKLSNKIVLNQHDKIYTTWEHLDNNGSIVSTSSETKSVQKGYDPRKRSWFKQAMNAPKQGAWSDIYDFFTTKEKGITYSIPVYYKGDFVGALGADISISQLNRLLKESVPSSIVSNFSTHLFLVYHDKLIGDSWGNMFIGQTVSKASSMGQFYLQNKQNLNKIIKTKLQANNETAPYYGYLSRDTMRMGEVGGFYIGFISLEAALFNSVNNTVLIVIFITIFTTILIALISMVTINKLALPMLHIETSLQNFINFKFTHSDFQKSIFKEINIIHRAIQGLENALLSFAKFVPDIIMNYSIQNNEVISNFVEKKRLVVMFSDIIGFTPISETVDTQELLKNIERYFSTCMEIIKNNEGIIDKTIGDGIMALWNTPVDIEDFEYKACIAAIQIQQKIGQLNKEFEQTNFPRFDTRIGIHVDSVLVGAIGHKDRLNYTAMGSGVNIASRIESANTKVPQNIKHDNILISESIYLCVQDRLICHYVGNFELKGIQEEMPLYSLPIQIA